MKANDDVIVGFDAGKSHERENNEMFTISE